MVQAGPIDEELDDFAAGISAAREAAARRSPGCRRYGPAEAAVTIVVLCSPTSANCRSPLRRTQAWSRTSIPTPVRVVWAPYFDVAREDAADLSLLADAALCAEKVGTASERRRTSPNAASPGWRWVERSARRVQQPPPPGRRRPADRASRRRSSRSTARAFATCRAQLAGTTVTWIEAARRSGVRMTPATVVGGRIYGRSTDRATLQRLVEAELGARGLGSCSRWCVANRALTADGACYL